ncbi:MAG: hypothetical protein DWQ34_17880 [Planctomycetota bacterium]|nr:MAG: hypothetical protein DWQ29_10450 [Planctomycetota bacterium]REJ90232.1 MAG: hypothetical protein DWQ34_17880 [Planctomycetota bacterium]REK20834.1 MAG: hypothetical protein DWQ41_23615 [Planctomycetota bacterium]REK36061.1 MAG: hypothetical protein DWQ45_10275 [Planctomycetota bacterium]
MAKRRSAKLSAGSSIRVLDGVAMPESPDVDISGWTGVVTETKGRGAQLKLIIEWDKETLDRMPASYRKSCEDTGLYYGMACLPASDVASANSEPES